MEVSAGFAMGEVVTLSATPDEGWSFEGCGCTTSSRAGEIPLSIMAFALFVAVLRLRRGAAGYPSRTSSTAPSSADTDTGALA